MKVAAEFPILCHYIEELASKRMTAVFPWEETPTIYGIAGKSPTSTLLNYLLAFKGETVITDLLNTKSCVKLLHRHRKKLFRYILEIERTVNDLLYKAYYTRKFVFFKVSHRHIVEPFLCKRARQIYNLPVFVVSSRGTFATEIPTGTSPKVLKYMGCVYSRRKLSFEDLCKFFGLF